MQDDLEKQGKVKPERCKCCITEEVTGIACKQGSVEYDMTRCKRLRGEFRFYQEKAGKKWESCARKGNRIRIAPGDVDTTVKTEQKSEDSSDQQKSPREVNASKLFCPS